MNRLSVLAFWFVSNLGPASLQIGILILLVCAVTVCLRRFPARYRYTLWLFVLMRLIVPVPMSLPFGIGQYPGRILSMGLERIPGLRWVVPTAAPRNAPSDSLQNSGGQVSIYPAQFSGGAMRFLFLSWCFGVAVLGLVVVTRSIQIQRRTGAPLPIVRRDLLDAFNRLAAQIGLKRKIMLLQAGDALSIPFPVVRGFSRPAVILPGSMASEWTAEALEPVLLHELSHIKRKDSIVNVVQIALQILYFYHPMVWLANWMMRRERELACDDEVVRNSGGSPAGYVRSMLQAAEASISSGSRQVLSIAMAENYSNLGRRIMRMMHARYRVSERHGLAYFAAVLILAFFCAAVSAQGPQTSADPSTRPLMMYSEFEKMVSEAALRSGIPESVIADVLKNFKEANDARILHPQEWRSSILNLLYSKSIPYDLAVQFLSSIPSKPLDIGYLDKLRSAKGNDSGIYPVLIGPVYTMNDGLVPLKPPTVTYQPLPQYTDEARQARVEGIILIQAIVRKDGAVVRPVILKGLGYGLDEAAIDTITTQWRFEPGTLNGTPVSVLANIELSFKLY